MSMRTARMFFVCALCALACWPSSRISAAEYPEKPVNVILPFGAGGGADLIMRPIEQVAKKYFSQPLVIVYRPGAGGVIATNELKNARPDGYTMGFAQSGPMSTQPAMNDVPYDVENDFVYVGGFVFDPILLVVRSEQQFTSLEQFITAMRGKQPTWSCPAIGSVAHLAGAGFLKENGIDARMVPSASGTEAVTNLMGGHIDFAFCHAAEAMPGFLGDELVFLATMSEKRRQQLPDVPTFTELGFEYVYGVLRSFAVPKGTPEPIVNELNAMLQKVLADPEFTSVMAASSTETEYIPPEKVLAQFVNDYHTFKQVVKDLNLR